MHNADFFQKYEVAGQLSELFDQMPGFLYFVKDDEFKLVAVNRRLAEKIAPENPESAIGMKDEDYVPQHMVEVYRADDESVLQTGKPITGKVELVTRGLGLVDWSVTTKTALLDSEGVVRGIIGVTRPFESAVGASIIDADIGIAVDFMKNQCDQNTPIKDLAAMVHMSVSTFERKFKKVYKMNPKEYVRHLRVQRACHQVAQTDCSLAEVAQNCGFSDQSHFSREFSKLMKESPKQYRKRYRL